MAIPDGLFDALYQRLLLRDVFGKILPGLFLLGSIAVAGSNISSVTTLLGRANVLASTLLLGAGWIAGFAIQSAGKVLRLCETYPRSRHRQSAGDRATALVGHRRTTDVFFTDDRDFIEKLTEFHSRATPDELQRKERFVVIKEATGNSFVALCLGSAVLLLDFILERTVNGSPPVLNWNDVAPTLAPAVAALFLTFALRRQHLRASRNEADLITLLTDPRTEPRVDVVAERTASGSQSKQPVNSELSSPTHSEANLPSARPPAANHLRADT